ncbi:MAG TPA: DUF885 domain-containing protein [Actinomycetota bacterium]|nr:DUF885 domain-containing protein [Actinomycetota bacterium]
MTPNDQVRQLVDRFWQGFLERQPLAGTYVGDERFDDRLPDPSENGRAAEDTACRGALAELAAIDRTQLDEPAQLDADVLEAVCARSLAALEHRVDRFEVVNHMHGAGTMIAQIASVQRADTPERLDRYEARLRAFPAFLDASAEVAREAVATGVVTSTIVAERALAQLDRILALSPEDSPAMLPLGPDADPGTRERFVSVVRDVVAPAHTRFRDLMRDEYLPAATETIGMTALPGGAGMYAAEILGWTSLPLDPADVHRLGNERFEAIQAERRQIATDLGYASPLEAITAHNASGANTAATPDQLVVMAEDQVRRSWETAPSFFGTLPKANCTVRRVEEFREADEPFAFYNPPTEDGSRPGTYYINTYDLPDRALHHVASVTYHEANPGHHFQIALEQEMTDRSDLRRFGGTLAGAAHCEGWGLYAERLADEMGLYLDDWERLGMLDNQAHRAARLITDTGIHALGWTREAAIDTLEEAGQTHTDAVIEVDRYIGMPGQALCYMIGMIEIERAREAAAAAANGDFSLRAFHDRVLATGELPLPSFRRVFGTD